MVWFLQHQVGFCTFFASAMTLMARSLGMPARMAVGFTSGSYDSKSASYIVKESASHAWTQIYFAKYGWVNFEPTSSFSLFPRPSALDATPTPGAGAGGAGATATPGLRDRGPRDPDLARPSAQARLQSSSRRRSRSPSCCCWRCCRAGWSDLVALALPRATARRRALRACHTAGRLGRLAATGPRRRQTSTPRNWASSSQRSRRTSKSSVRRIPLGGGGQVCHQTLPTTYRTCIIAYSACSHARSPSAPGVSHGGSSR